MNHRTSKVTLLASLGAGLEYYDFIIYGMMAHHLGHLFFPGIDPSIGLMKSFGVFAVGYLIRPLGGVFFGTLGDTFGRKKIFTTVMLLMAISTFLMGVLPNYDQIGILATILLTVLRILQGLSFGAELPGALVVVSENTTKEKQGSYSSFVLSSTGLGASLASLVLLLLSSCFQEQEIRAYAWRLPFLFGGILAIANYFIRKNLQETPEYIIYRKSHPQVTAEQTLTYLYKGFVPQVLVGIGSVSFLASLVIFIFYFPSWILKHYSYSSSDVYLALTVGLVFSSIILPLCGRISDKFNRKRLFIYTCMSYLIFVYPMLSFIHDLKVSSLALFLMLYQIFIAFLTVTALPLLLEVFPVNVRYTGVAVCYNLAYALMGGAPLLFSYLDHSFSSPLPTIFCLACCSLVSCLCSIYMNRSQNPIRMTAQT